ncbi:MULTISPECIES: serine hydrolase domain-containing protein, partial [Cupriavidus]
AHECGIGWDPQSNASASRRADVRWRYFSGLLMLILPTFARLSVALSLLASTTVACARLPAPVAAAEVGMSAGRLGAVGDWMQSQVESKRVPGAVMLIVRNGQVAYFEAVGQQDPVHGTPMSKDSISRIYSMTKPMTSVVAMMLVEEGKLQLDAPLSRFLLAFATMKVGVERKDPATGAKTLESVGTLRPITVHDLLRHTSGITYGVFGDSAVERLYRAAQIGLHGDFTNAELADRVAALPLQNQPGTAWEYGFSTDVLGRVLEVVEGQTLGTIMRRRLFAPLGMKDTGFGLP